MIIVIYATANAVMFYSLMLLLLMLWDFYNQRLLLMLWSFIIIYYRSTVCQCNAVMLYSHKLCYLTTNAVRFYYNLYYY